MELDDFGEFEKPSQVPPRTLKLTPKQFNKAKSHSSLESEFREHISKLEPQKLVAPFMKKSTTENAEESEPNLMLEQSAFWNGAVKMEVDSKVEIMLTNVEDRFMAVDDEHNEDKTDLIVREIDVFITPSSDPETKIYVFQYPLRPCWRPYELDEHCEEVRVKPSSAQVEVDFSMDGFLNCCENSARGSRNQTLTTKWHPPLKSGYAVGVLIGDKLHLNPAYAIVQLRPVMKHMESGSSKKKINVVESILPDASNDNKLIGHPKQLSKQMRQVNNAKSDTDECWIPLKYHDSKSDFSAGYFQKMVTNGKSLLEFKMNPYNYMISLCPDVSHNNIQPGILFKRSLLALPLQQRIINLLSESSTLLRFDQIKKICPDSSSEDIVKTLQKNGQLVQGLWALKSSLLIPGGGPHEMIKRAARDYILNLFRKNLVINFSDVNVPSRLRDDVVNFLNKFAVERLMEWKFKEKADTLFMELFPQAVKEQEHVWQITEKKLNELFQSRKAGAFIPNYGINLNNANPSNRERSTIKNTSTMHTKIIASETQEALLKVLPKIFQSRKVCSFQLICQGLRDFAISQSTLPKADPRIAVAAASGVDAPPDELQEVINQVATSIHGFYVLKSSSDHPEYDPLRKIVIDLLLARGPNGKLKKAEVLEAARLILKRGVTNIEYNRVMTDFCESKGSAWTLKSIDGQSS